MSARRLLSLALISLTSASLVLFTACGGGSGNIRQSMPVFTSTPVTAATQSVVYTYTLAATDPTGGAVTFSLTTAPTGATLSGSTISWTPTAAQSRTPNSFTATASTSGGSATQSWSVSPAGTVTVSWINDYWGPGGPIPYPVSPSASLTVSAVVPQADGSIIVLPGSTVSPGIITIDAVPAGNYWLTFGSSLVGALTNAIWTTTSSFDAGRWIAGFVPGTAPSSTTTFQVALSGLDSVPASTSVYFDPAIRNALFGLFLDSPNSTTLNATLNITSTTDWTVTTQQFLAQYEASTFGPWSTLNIGASATTALTFTNGGTNPVTVTLSPSAPANPIDVNVIGTQWAALFNNAAPAPASPMASGLTIAVEPFVSGQGVFTPSSENLLLTGTPLLGAHNIFFFPTPTGCDPGGFFPLPQSTQPAILTDQDLGQLTYGDPFSPANPNTSWIHTETFCEQTQVPVPIPGSNTPALFTLVDSATVSPSSTAIVPVVSQIQSPTIDGGSLFTLATLSNATPMLSWTAPATGSPFAYRVFVYVLQTVNGTPLYANAGTFLTSQTSVTLPPLSGGNTYVFAVAAMVDGGANEQVQPFRSVIPVGSATVISAPFTIPAGASTPKIRGDARVVKRLSQPQPRVTPR